MNTDDMRNNLHNEYLAISHDWTVALTDLELKIRDLNETRRESAQLKSDLEFYQSSALLAETHKEGRINGSNEQTRKQQAALLLKDLRTTDPEYKALADAVDRTQLHDDELQVDIQVLQSRISFLRNQSRMVAGLSYALAGV